MTSTPLVYSCSGCSNVAQLANNTALELNAQGKAEMSCIAGVGGGVKSLVKRAQSARPVIALDGCQLKCVKYCLEKVDVEPELHIVLTDHGFVKQKDTQYIEDEVTETCNIVMEQFSQSTSS